MPTWPSPWTRTSCSAFSRTADRFAYPRNGREGRKHALSPSPPLDRDALLGCQPQVGGFLFLIALVLVTDAGEGKLDHLRFRSQNLQVAGQPVRKHLRLLP